MNKCIFKCKQVLGKKVTGEWLRHSLRVFLARQRARIFSSKKTKNSGCFTATSFAASFHLSVKGLAFFLRKKRENSGCFTATSFAASFSCSQRASIFASKKTQKLGKY